MLHLPQEASVGRARCSRLRVVRSKRLFANGGCLPIERKRLGCLLLSLPETCQGVQGFGDSGVLRTQLLLTQRQGTLIEQLGLLMILLRCLEGFEIFASVLFAAGCATAGCTARSKRKRVFRPLTLHHSELYNGRL